jgi:hypothetical protein
MDGVKKVDFDLPTRKNLIDQQEIKQPDAVKPLVKPISLSPTHERIRRTLTRDTIMRRNFPASITLEERFVKDPSNFLSDRKK